MVTLSRRALIGAGVVMAAAGVAGCTKALRSAVDPTSRTSDTSAVAPAPTGDAPDTTIAESAVDDSALPASPSPLSTAVGDSAAPATTASTPATTNEHSGPAVEVVHGPRDQPRVALTFHGAGDIDLARQILKIANAKGAHITVMVVGTWLASTPAIAQAFLADGHELGNHTWSHQDINSLAEADMSQEVIRCRDLLIQVTGSPGAYFRPSQTPTANDLVKQVAGAAGYATSLSYDVDSLDYTDPGAASIRRNMAAAQPGSVVSMHLGHQDTVDALPGVLDDLAARGLAAVTVGTLLTG